MESKRKNRKVLKGNSARKAVKKKVIREKPSSEEALIRYNGELIEDLVTLPVWTDIVLPLVIEMIASVSGRLTNGRFYKGLLTKSQTDLPWLAGYQCALEEFTNNLDDFIKAKNNLQKKNKEEMKEKNVEVYNPFLEDFKYGEETITY